MARIHNTLDHRGKAAEIVLRTLAEISLCLQLSVNRQMCVKKLLRPGKDY